MIHLIVAVAENGAIGKDNQLLWHLPDDLKRFKQLTTGHPVIMGRKTYESIGKPLPNRTNIIITRDQNYTAEGCVVVSSVEEALYANEDVYIIGGAEIYRQTLPYADNIHLTEVHTSIEGDTFFPKIAVDEWLELNREHHPADEKHQYSFDFVKLTRTNVEKIKP
ncbi:MAG: dihydrofolate reductase [Siphonobacter sp.]